MKAIKVTLSIIVIAALGFGYIHWMSAHDAAMEKAMTAYDTCVQSQYGMSASSYYQVHGTTPDCK